MGTTSRWWPGRSGVYPSVACTTTSARTVPCGVLTRPRSMAVTGVCSWIWTPRAATASARPRTSRARSSAAQCGVKVPPTWLCPSVTMSATCAASSRRMWSRRSPTSASRPPRRVPGPTARGSGHRQVAAAGQSAVDALRFDHARRPERWRSSRAASARRHPGWTTRRPCARGREDRRTPPAVTARGAEPGHLPLQHRHAQRRIGHRQVVRRPQPRVASPHHRHVHCTVAGQRRTRAHDPGYVSCHRDSPRYARSSAVTTEP